MTKKGGRRRIISMLLRGEGPKGLSKEKAKFFETEETITETDRPPIREGCDGLSNVPGALDMARAEARGR